jgi:hypothetical protein
MQSNLALAAPCCAIAMHRNEAPLALLAVELATICQFLVVATTALAG